MKILTLASLFLLPSLCLAMPNEPVRCQTDDGTVVVDLSTWRSSGNPDGSVRAEVNGVTYASYDDANPAHMGQYWSDSEGVRMKIMIPGKAFGDYESAALVFVTRYNGKGTYPAAGTLEIWVQEITDLPWRTVVKKSATCAP
jgi:hypothetical protein